MSQFCGHVHGLGLYAWPSSPTMIPLSVVPGLTRGDGARSGPAPRPRRASALRLKAKARRALSEF